VSAELLFASGHALTSRLASLAKKLPPESLTTGEVQRLLATYSLRTLTGTHIRALVDLLYRKWTSSLCGLRAIAKDLDPEAGTVVKGVLPGTGFATTKGKRLARTEGSPRSHC
jgi:site-specific recombinase XerD